MTDSLFDNDAPAPMAQFKDSFYKVDKHNQRLLDDEKARQSKIFDRKSLKKARKQLEKLQLILDEHDVDPMLDELQNLLDEFNMLKKQYLKCKEKLVLKPDDPELLSSIAILKENRLTIVKDASIVKKRIYPYRNVVVQRDVVKGRIDEHINMVMDMKQAIKDAREMAKEANIFASIIIKAWASIGFKYERTRKGKIKTDYIRFEKIIATPDDIQYKVDVSKLGLIDGTVHNLPQGVRSYELVDPKILKILSVATERDVTSPNNDGDCDWSKGVWVRVYRHNYKGGLMSYVSYKHVMDRYPYKDKDKFPLPMGVKAGRHINWVNLVDHPHWLFAGQTGAGKTNTVRVGLSTLISQHSPDEIRFILIDLKGNGDLNPYENAPHCIGKVVKNVEDVAILIKQIEALMVARMTQISKITNDIVDYNKIVEPENRLPRIVVVFDEYGAIGARGKDIAKEIEASARMIAIQSRAAGIHLWLGIQQSFSDSMDKMIKGNLTIAFGGRQRTQGGAMSVSGNASTMKLAKIPGRMLCDDGNDAYQIQMPFLTKDDLNKSLAVTSKWDKPRPLNLPELANSEAVKYEVIEPFNEEMVIRIALEQFDGHLKGKQIWEWIDRHDVSRNKVYDTIKDIVACETVVFDDVEYGFTKIRNRFQLTELPTYQQNAS